MTALVPLQGWLQADAQRRVAEEQERRNRLLLYVARMNLAQQACSLASRHPVPARAAPPRRRP